MTAANRWKTGVIVYRLTEENQYAYATPESELVMAADYDALTEQNAKLVAALKMAARYAERSEAMSPADLADVQALLKSVST